MQEDLIFSMHPSQFDVYADQLLDTKSPHYNIGGYIKLKGLLNKKLFYKAVGSGAETFDAFRMRFDLTNSEPQILLDRSCRELQMSDVDFSKEHDPEQHAAKWMQDRFNIPFAFEKESPLYEQCLIKISETEHWFFGKYHHLITDGYGFVVWVQYLAQKYRMLLEDDVTPLHFSSYIEEAAKAAAYKKSSTYMDDSVYWLDKISAKPKKILSKKPDNLSKKKSDTYFLELSQQQRGFLDKIEETTKIRLHHLTIAALYIYYGQTSGEAEFFFGIPVHKRSSREARNIVGMFSGIIPYKNNYRKDITLTDLLKEIIQTQKEDYKHQYYPVGDLARALKVKPQDGYLFDIVINYKPLNFEISFDEQIQATTCELSNEFLKYPLQLCWQDYGKQQPLQLQMDYGTDYFNREEIGLLAQRLLYILSQFPVKFDKPVGDFKILPPDEREAVLKFSTGISKTFPDKNIVTLFEEQVLSTPQATAIVFGNESLTYDELNKKANQLSHYLRTKGIKEETLVPLCIERCLDMSIAIIGILKAGGAYVPVDPDYPGDRIKYMLEDSGASIILCNNKSKEALLANANYEFISLDGDWETIKAKPDYNVSNQLTSANIAYVIYTSGSTGKPKGVMNQHDGIANRLNWAQDYFKLTPDDAILQKTSFSFDVSVWELLWPLLTGAKIVFANPGGQKDNEYLKKVIDEHKITMIHFVPSMLGVFLPDVNLDDCKSLKKVLCSGEALSPSHANLFKQKLPKVELHNLYGPTEAAIDVTCWTMNHLDDNEIKIVPIGKPVANTQTYILNDKDQILPSGIPGEIHIGGVQVARGYVNKPDLTAQKFIANPFDKKQKSTLYKTGDLGRWLVDGNIEYIGRIDDQVKIRGFRIELGEIETVFQQCELVQQAVVVTRSNVDGNKQLVGYIVPEGSFDKDNIANYLKSRLPEYMVPVLLIELSTLPLTPNGKVDRKALPDPTAADMVTNVYEEPKKDLEIKLTEIWQEILGATKIGINDNFFDLGGHSLNAMQLTSRVYKQSNIKIDIGNIFANPTIKQLAIFLSGKKSEVYVPIKKLPLQDSYQLSHAQKRFWILSHYKDGSKAYNFSAAFVIKGDVNSATFKKAILKVIERHEILRTVFKEIDGEPRQVILNSGQLDFELKEIILDNYSDVKRIISEAKENNLATPYELNQGPLFRATLFRHLIEGNIMLFGIHHIVSDGWSKEIMMNEILNFYQSEVGSDKLPLPSLPIQYKDYAAWHNEELLLHKDYWYKLFSGSIPLLDFPGDYERPKVVTFLGEMLTYSIPEKLKQDLKLMASIHGTSLNNLIFSLYALLVSQYSEQDKVIIGSLSSGRSNIDVENLIGAFINFLPIQLEVDSDSTLDAYIQNCNHALLEAYKHQDYPFDMMVNELIKQRDFSRNPFFDTMVNFHSENGVHLNDINSGNIANKAISIEPYNFGVDDLYQSVLDFKLDVELSDTSLDLYLSFNSKLYTRSRMTQFLDNFILLLTTAVNEPGKQLNYYNKLEREKEGVKIDTPSAKTNIPELPVHICSSFVAEPLKEFIDYWNKELELNFAISFAPYNQVFQQLLNPSSLLNKNSGLNVLFIRVDDWLKEQKGLSDQQQVDFLNETYAEFIKAIKQVNESTVAPFLVTIIPLSPDSLLSNLVTDQIQSLNSDLKRVIKSMQRLNFFNLEEVVELYGVSELFDPKSDEVGHIPFTREGYAAVATYLVRKISALKGPGYKVIALDCDNTLWKGICGEVGAINVVIDEHFSQLQDFVLMKYNEGFLIVLCSKNNEDDVWEVFEKHSGMKLRREHIISHRINWDAKSQNLAAIAKELNVGIDSFIFIDDNEFEIEQMSANRPEVLSITLPEEPHTFSEFLNHIWAFDTFKITDEDRRRNKMYQVDKDRIAEQVNHSSVDDFLASLNIKVNMGELEDADLDRAVQLTLRTNQFNLNGIRKTSHDIRECISQKDSCGWIIEVSDRFGDYGIIGLILGHHVNAELIIETFLLSCRILGRNVEEIILEWLRQYCIEQNLESIRMLFQKTAKNKPFEEFILRTHWMNEDKSENFYQMVKDGTAPVSKLLAENKI